LSSKERSPINSIKVIAENIKVNNETKAVEKQRRLNNFSVDFAQAGNYKYGGPLSINKGIEEYSVA
jgi:hypothetical protein